MICTSVKLVNLISVTALLLVSWTTTSSVTAKAVHLKKRIVDGDVADKRLPWLVSIQSSAGSHYCSGSLYTPYKIITGRLPLVLVESGQWLTHGSSLISPSYSLILQLLPSFNSSHTFSPPPLTYTSLPGE